METCRLAPNLLKLHPKVMLTSNIINGQLRIVYSLKTDSLGKVTKIFLKMEDKNTELKTENRPVFYSRKCVSNKIK